MAYELPVTKMAQYKDLSLLSHVSYLIGVLNIFATIDRKAF